MTGIAIATRGVLPANDWRRITVGNSGNSYGYATIGFAYGTINSAAYLTGTIGNLFYNNNTSLLNVQISPTGLPQAFFNRIYLQKAGGIWVFFDTAAASYNPSLGVTTSWQWLGVPTVWSAPDLGAVRAIILTI